MSVVVGRRCEKGEGGGSDWICIFGGKKKKKSLLISKDWGREGEGEKRTALASSGKRFLEKKEKEP